MIKGLGAQAQYYLLEIFIVDRSYKDMACIIRFSILSLFAINIKCLQSLTTNSKLQELREIGSNVDDTGFNYHVFELFFDQVHGFSIGSRSLAEKSQLADKSKRFNTKKVQQCKDSGEAYSAAYLIHKDHLLNQFTNYNLTWVNCEMGLVTI